MMSGLFISAAFGLFSLVNWLGSFFAIFPFLGLMTNANGFLSGDGDVLMLALLASLPVCAVVSGILYKLRGERLAGLAVSAVPTAIGLLLVA